VQPAKESIAVIPEFSEGFGLTQSKSRSVEWLKLKVIAVNYSAVFFQLTKTKIVVNEKVNVSLMKTKTKTYQKTKTKSKQKNKNKN